MEEPSKGAPHLRLSSFRRVRSIALEASLLEKRNRLIMESASCSREDPPATKKGKLILRNAHENKDEHTPSWVPIALRNINAVGVRMLEFTSLPSPKTCLPDLERLRRAATALVNSTDAVMSSVKAKQDLLDRKALEEKLLALQQELAKTKKQSLAELLKQRIVFQQEKESLTCSHKLERETLINQHTHEQWDLKTQLEEEKHKSICCVCHEKPRDTIILPCLHFQYCFSCLLRHREANSNTCPTCRGPIQGLSMSSYLATQ